MLDEEVVTLAHDGTSGATEFLLGRYRGMVETKARAYFLAGADHEDVVQEGMIGLCKAIRDYRDDQSHKFRPFAELCITRQIISAVKSATRHKHAPLNASVSLNQGFGDESVDGTLMDLIPDSTLPAPDEAVLHDELPEAIHEMVEHSLSELERGVLWSYLDGKSYREMSCELKCRTKSIDNALQRVKKKLGCLIEG